MCSGATISLVSHYFLKRFFRTRDRGAAIRVVFTPFGVVDLRQEKRGFLSACEKTQVRTFEKIDENRERGHVSDANRDDRLAIVAAMPWRAKPPTPRVRYGFATTEPIDTNLSI